MKLHFAKELFYKILINLKEVTGINNFASSNLQSSRQLSKRSYIKEYTWK